ncbi:MAG TPA: DinB family protein [Candidatus Paceibacterota bacterium]
MTKETQKQIDDWLEIINKLPFDLLKQVSEEDLSLTVGKNMGTLGEQFRHMIRTRFQYAEAIENKKLADIIERLDPSISKSKKELIILWEKANKKLVEVVQNTQGDLVIDWKHWGAPSMNLRDHLNVLMDHETLHIGELIVYIKTHEIPFPKSWTMWGL